jgi:hypothetical protein
MAKPVEILKRKFTNSVGLPFQELGAAILC